MSKFLVIGLLAVTGAAPSAPRPPRALADAIAAYDDAQVKGDRAALLRLLAPDYLLVNSGGETEDRARFVADLTAPGYRLDPFVVRHPVLRVWSGGAVAGGVARLSGVDSGKAYSVCLRFADVWSRREGRWLVAYSQASRADPSACEGG